MNLAGRKNASTIDKVVRREYLAFTKAEYVKMFLSNHVNCGYGRK